MPGGTSRICAATEQELHNYARKGMDAKKDAALPELQNIPPDIAKTLKADKLLSLEEWRKIWAGHIREELRHKAQNEFAQASRYAAGGQDAEAGMNYAIGVSCRPRPWASSSPSASSIWPASSPP